jgi:hypothetical protein
MKKISRKGAELTVGTLVIIVLAIIVLVVVALGFGTGWSNLWQKITGYFGGGVNVDDVKSACTYACTTKAAYNYCCVPKEVVFEKGGTPVMITCNKEGAQKLGLAACGDIDCSSSDNANLCASVTCTGGTSRVKPCLDTENPVSSKTLDASGNVIPAGSVCCEPKIAKKCDGNVKACTDLSADKAKCDAQKTLKGTTIITCKYVPASGSTAAKCDVESGYAVIQCRALTLTGTDAQKEQQCTVQQGCAWA